MKKGKFKIFIVDDDPLLLRAMQYALSEHRNLDIACFDSGKSCIKNINEKPEVVVLDYHLGDSNGSDVLKTIKRVSPLTKVIMLTSETSKKISLQSIQDGAYDYIEKNENSCLRVANIIKHIGSSIKVTRSLENATVDYTRILIVPIILWVLIYALSVWYQNR